MTVIIIVINNPGDLSQATQLGITSSGGTRDYWGGMRWESLAGSAARGCLEEGGKRGCAASAAFLSQHRGERRDEDPKPSLEHPPADLRWARTLPAQEQEGICAKGKD